MCQKYWNRDCFIITGERREDVTEEEGLVFNRQVKELIRADDPETISRAEAYKAEVEQQERQEFLEGLSPEARAIELAANQVEEAQRRFDELRFGCDAKELKRRRRMVFNGLDSAVQIEVERLKAAGAFGDPGNPSMGWLGDVLIQFSADVNALLKVNNGEFMKKTTEAWVKALNEQRERSGRKGSVQAFAELLASLAGVETEDVKSVIKDVPAIGP